MNVKPLRNITCADADGIREFIRKTVRDAKAKGAVVGISGGVDSAVVAKLCADALGGENVLCVFMPTSVTPVGDFMLTKDICKEWGTRYTAVSVQSAVDAFSGMLLTGKEAPLEKGNIMARCRMIVLYDKAKKEDYLVMGTTNRSETLMGYMTKFGDGAEDAAPMFNLYKTQVWELAKLIGIPKEIIDKVPTAGLWEGQTDESEMGITYHELDIVLNAMEQGMSDTEISTISGTSEKKIAEIRSQTITMAHKYKPVTVPPRA